MLEMEPDNINIEPVETRSARADFVRVGRNVYSKGSPWLKPLNSVVRDHLDEATNPFYKMAEGRAFLAREGDRVVGRIMVALCGRFERLHCAALRCD